MEQYKQLMEYFLLAYDQGKGESLSDFIDYLDQNGHVTLFEHRYFYDFWLILHQRSPIINGDVDEEEGQTLLGDALALLKNRTLIVEEGKGIINRYKRFSIQEFQIRLEEKDDAIR